VLLRVRARFVLGLTLAALTLAACGERAHIPIGSATGSHVVTNQSSGSGPTTSTTAGSTSTTLPTLPKGTRHSTTVPSVTIPESAAGDNPTQKAILTAYESYLTDLSGLDDNLSQGYIGPLASVTTTRLAEASVRQAAAILAAQEHGVGTLRDDHLTIVMTGQNSAALADCQDENDFYLVSDDSGAADPFVARGDFAGSAQMVLQNGHWLVDVFTTTHVTCSY
jgi:hypothetical protein